MQIYTYGNDKYRVWSSIVLSSLYYLLILCFTSTFVLRPCHNIINVTRSSVCWIICIKECLLKAGECVQCIHCIRVPTLIIRSCFLHDRLPPPHLFSPPVQHHHQVNYKSIWWGYNLQPCCRSLHLSVFETHPHYPVHHEAFLRRL